MYAVLVLSGGVPESLKVRDSLTEAFGDFIEACDELDLVTPTLTATTGTFTPSFHRAATRRLSLRRSECLKAPSLCSSRGH